MCGVVGILGNDYIAQDLYDALVTLQHRGQDAAGMVTYDGKFHLQKELGLVKEVFHTRHMRTMLGNVGIGHTRYSTFGGGGVEDSQPFIGQSPFGVMLAHNGNVWNSYDLKKELFEKDHRLVNSDNDAEVVLHVFTKCLSRQSIDKLTPAHIWKGIQSVFDRTKGAYSVVGYIAGHGMFAFRDPYGIRPLLFGKRINGLNADYIFASESIPLDVLGFEMLRDVGPGEGIFIDEKTRKIYTKNIRPKKHSPCVFEYIYFARPDSLLDNISVYKSRLRMGQMLAKEIKKSHLKIDVVMPVPDSSRAAAFAMADELKLRYREGLVKNRYIGRTFIMPGQAIRRKSIKYKLNPIKLEIKGKNILLVDDSIVRGNTSREIIQMVRNAGAKKVYFASCSPRITSPCLYGIDIPTKEELIASSNSNEEIRKFIGADALFYSTVEGTFQACVRGNKKLSAMCMACMTGKYPTGDITEAVLKKNSETRVCDKANCDRVEEEAQPGDRQLNLI